MSRLEHPFSTFVKQHRSLDALLNEYTQQVTDRIRAVRSLGDLASLEEEIVESVASAPEVRFVIGGRRPASVRPTEPAQTMRGSKTVVTRHHVAVQIIGDIFLSCRWPTDSEDLIPADDPSWPESGLSTLDARDEVWTIGFDDETEEKTWALYTYFDLTLEDEARIASGDIDLALIVEERVSRIEPIVNRIDRELVQYTRMLPEELAAALSSKRQELTNRIGVSKALRFPKEWVVKPIALEEPSPLRIDSEPSQGPTFLPIAQVPRLEPASFERLQTTVRVWADSVERHPGGFRKLTEDQISDLLCATLNATLAGANREVFSRSGKTDIFVRADILSEGLGSAKVFVAESKKATSKAIVKHAVEKQLFQYTTTSDVAAVLLLLFPQKDFIRVRDGYLEALREIDGFLDQRPSSVKEWPIYHYEKDGRVLSVCIAMVHL
jgi:chorismate mutase